MYILRLCAAIGALLGSTALVYAAPTSPEDAFRRRQAGVPLPASDSFYTPPAGYQNTAPGTVLKSRPIAAGILGVIPDPVFAWQLLYRSTAVNGSAIATVTTVFKPLVAKTDRFISYATAYDSSATQCDPSYSYRLGSNPTTNVETEAELLVIQGLLLQGYIVSSPDYEGPDAAFAPGHLEGMCVLDSMRAVTNFGSTIGFTTKTPAIVGVGYSGGAIATGWAASLAPSYAPELPVKGWAQGGTPANLTAVTNKIDDTEWSGFLPTAVAGLLAPSAYKAQLQSLFDTILTAKGKAAIQYAQTNCFESVLLKYAFVSVLSTDFQTLGPAILYEPTVQQVFADNTMGVTQSETPKAPVLVYHATPDEIIPYLDASELVDRWCSRGASVQFSTYTKGGHLTTLIVAIPEVFDFVNSAFAGTVAAGCSTKSYFTNTLDPVGLAVELEPIIANLVLLLGRAITADASNSPAAFVGQ
ncbi:LIP-domain-containing protein [Myriangium duriaei CBS 260.36]|uniref:LIP-domain-containing protein n=1 Tax=Myriangium duriaei CBS 260.36 TaxID=1168546 RepID=A0A9P4ISY5_9PEZI|nr:LIP-domain-containing protein [Myriangium duriaei CBS 260.36]